jgi:hypothetical protein
MSEIQTSETCLDCGIGDIDASLSVQRHGSAKVLLSLQTVCPDCGEEEEYITSLTKNP